MTEQELHIAVCKELGYSQEWRSFEPETFGSDFQVWVKEGKTVARPPLTLDLMHEAEKTLTEEQRVKYAKELDWNCSDMLCEPLQYSGERVNWPQAFEMIHATTLQRATAFIAVKQKGI